MVKVNLGGENVKIGIPFEKVSPLDLVCIAEGFHGRYDDLYIDGDGKELVIVNPKPELLEALKRAGQI